MDRLRRHPRLYLPPARRLRKRSLRGEHRMVERRTDLVIEAFPRSGNTFASFAFESAQNRPVRLAHHAHAPAQVLAAAGWRVPCLVMLRQPDDAVLSLLIRSQFLTARQAMRSYVRFYETIEPMRDRFVLARFETVTSDFGKVIAAVNQKFETDFTLFEHTPENERAVYADLDAQHARLQGWRLPPATRREAVVGRPSPERRASKETLRPQLETTAMRPLRERAQHVYERLEAKADT